MDYKDILENQKNQLRSELKWWPNFLYHFTDVHNASSILNQGWIYSRERVEEQHIMANDNASNAVISATSEDSKCYGRLYFRPLTPTQFHNEGYKPIEVRKSDLNASCPVPVFFCLNANATLHYYGTKFAEKGIAGHRHNIQHGVEKFSELNFSKIYHEGWFTEEEKDIIEYRHSEVIREEGFPVEPLLKCILCRSMAEKETLLFLLKQFSLRMYNTYRDKILYKPKLKCFFNNGIYVKQVEVVDGVLKIYFNDPEQRHIPKDKTDVRINVKLSIEYKAKDGRVLSMQNAGSNLNYAKVRACRYELSSLEECDCIRLKVSIDDAVMYENEIALRDELF